MASKDKETEQDSNITVFMFEDETSAQDFLDTVMQWQEKGLFNIIDSVIAVRGVGSDIEVTQSHKFGGKYAAIGSGIGLAAGLLLGGPIGGLAVGAIIGGVSGAMKDYGIPDKFIEEVDQGLGANSSALFLMTSGGEGNMDKILEELRPFKIRIASTTLAGDQEAKLKEALSREE